MLAARNSMVHLHVRLLTGWTMSIYMYNCLPEEQCPFTCMTAYRMNNVHYATSVLKQQMVFPTTALQTRWSIYIRVLRRFPGSANTRSRRKSSWLQLYVDNETNLSARTSNYLSIQVLHGSCAKTVCDLSTHEVCGIHDYFFFAHIRGIFKC
jgi:hypothetical protein